MRLIRLVRLGAVVVCRHHLHQHFSATSSTSSTSMCGCHVHAQKIVNRALCLVEGCLNSCVCIKCVGFEDLTSLSLSSSWLSVSLFSLRGTYIMRMRFVVNIKLGLSELCVPDMRLYRSTRNMPVYTWVHHLTCHRSVHTEGA